MERSKSFDSRWERILACSGTNSDSALARELEILPQSVTAAKKRQQIPSGWIEKISEKFNTSTDWLFFGRGPMRPGEPEQPAMTAPQQPVTAPETPACARCAKLEAELELEKSERRAMTAEIREINTENRQLMRENASLRIEVATQKEQLRAISGKSMVADIA